MQALIGWMLTLPMIAAAQQTKAPVDETGLNGVVLDQLTKEPVQGATVRIKGLDQSVITDDKGRFSFNTQKDLPYAVQISYVGYSATEILASKHFVTILLQGSSNQLSDIVVVGYGTQKKSDVSGSVVSLSGAALQQPAVSFDNLLQGGAPGVVVTQSNNQPGSTSTIRIRGGNSISFGNDPLYVIDGFILYNNNDYTNTGATTGASVNALATIDPSSIASMEILKDAAATAIYGSRGANGVIIITTKRGKKGHTAISYNGYGGIQKVAKYLPLLNGAQWGALVNDINLSDHVAPTYSQAALDSLGTGSDWQKAGVRTGTQQNHALSITGGDEKSKFALFGNYFDQKGILLNSGFKRYAVRFNYERTISERFKVTTSLSSSYIEEHSLTGGDYNGLKPAGAWSTLVRGVPVVPIYNADGSYYTENSYITTPTNYIQDITASTNLSKINRTLGNVSGEYKIIPDLTLKISAGADLINTKQNNYAPSITAPGYQVNGIAAVGSSQAVTWMNENTLTYKHDFNQLHFLEVLAGYTTQFQKDESVVAAAQGFANDLTSYNNLNSASTLLPAYSNAHQSTMNSYLARINYSYDHKYNITVSERADGASVLGDQNKWGYFPAIGLSWNLSKEDFFRVSSISNLKLRLSAGKTGNSGVPPYSALAVLAPTNYYLGSPLKLVTGLSPSQLANPDLKWETTTQYNAGIDFDLFKNRISIVFDAYYKKTTDLLLNVPFPVFSGYSSVLENVGSVENKGVEFSINSKNIQSNTFNWTTSLNFAANKNKVLSLGTGIDAFYPSAPVGQNSPVIVQVGLPVGTFWGYTTAGLLTQADLDNGVPLLLGVPQQVGDQKYVAQDGHKVITTADKHNLGNAQPKFTFGFQNHLDYNGFDLSVNWQGSYGNKIFNQLQQDLERPTLALGASATLLDRWRVDHPEGTMPRATNSPVPQVIDRFIEDGSYARLKDLTLGYSFSKALLDPLGIQDLRFYVSARNLVTITNYTGYDPEANYFDNDNTKQGIDYGIYPASRTFLFGLNLTF